MVREGKHSGIDDDTRARARRFAEDAGMPKPAVTGRALPKQRVVSKKELEESGLSLRDFLNRERGLTRREDKPMSKTAAEKRLGMGEKPSKEAVASAKERLGIEDSKKESAPDYMAESAKSRGTLNLLRRAAEEAPDYMAESAKSRGVRNMYERGAEEANATGMKKGGSVKGWGIARGARKAKMR